MRSLTTITVLVALALGGTANPASASVLETGITFPQDPTVTTFTNSWGAGRSGGRRHKGTDLLAPKLTPVYAVAAGEIVRMHWSRLGGYGMEIDHGDGVSSVYIHLNNDTPGTDDGAGYPEWTYAPGLEVGDFVEQGQFIAFVGDSGNAEYTTSHTHFEIHVDGVAQNPYPWVKPVYDAALAAAPALGEAESHVLVRSLFPKPARSSSVPATGMAID